MGRAEELFERIKTDGTEAIEEFIATRQSEELFLDFKRSADNGKGPKTLHTNDRNNLAKAISGFGNSEGGVIVWGVDASRDIDGADVAKAKEPIENVARFASWIEGLVSGCTIPPHPGVRHHPIDTRDGDGFVISLIPKSDLAPHQSVHDNRYYIRAGSTFQPTLHGVLAGMFGRRPQPSLSLRLGVSPAKIGTMPGGGIGAILELWPRLVNGGSTIARDPFINLLFEKPGSRCKLHTGAGEDPGHWAVLGYRVVSIVSNENFKLAPSGDAAPLKLYFYLVQPFTDALTIEPTAGCDNAPPIRLAVVASANEVELFYEAIARADVDAYELTVRFLKLGEVCERLP